MIAVGDPARMDVPPAVFDAHGGFAWWYVDAIDERGDGLVLIWSWGLPFLPGYLSGARRGEGEPARARPSLNVSVYRGGRRAFYLLQTYAEAEAEMDGAGGFRFGATHIRQDRPGQVRVELDCAVPRSADRLRGVVEVAGPPARLAPDLQPSPDPSHRWTPVLGPAWLEAHLTAGPERFAVAAPAYHDRNEGTRRFDDLGIDHWIWGRRARPEGTAIWYLTFAKAGPPVAWGAELRADGEVRLAPELEPVLEAPRRGPFGVRIWDRVRLTQPSGADWLVARSGPRVDDGPFYARTLMDVTSGGDEGVGLGEWIVPDRIDLGRHRPLVRMAVHETGGRPNSFWLPLFSGPRAGRVARLCGVGRGPRPSPTEETS
jgi:hypothetical protein